MVKLNARKSYANAIVNLQQRFLAFAKAYFTQKQQLTKVDHEA